MNDATIVAQKHPGYPAWCHRLSVGVVNTVRAGGRTRVYRSTPKPARFARANTQLPNARERSRRSLLKQPE
jgi:hypothetical protein